MRRTITWVLGVLLVGAVVVTGGTWAYIELVRDDPPDRLTVGSGGRAGDAFPAPGGARQGDDGTAVGGVWRVASGSQVGYRVKEVLFGQDTEAVGRTSDVSGELTIAGTTVTAARLVVDLTTVESDDDRRDNQFRGRIMDTDTHPEATFVLTEPIRLDALPADGETVTVSATGQFTIRGVTNPASFALTARRHVGAIEVHGAIPIAFADYGIPDASFGPAQVEDHGEIELLVTFARSA